MGRTPQILVVLSLSLFASCKEKADEGAEPAGSESPGDVASSGAEIVEKNRASAEFKALPRTEAFLVESRASQAASDGTVAVMALIEDFETDCLEKLENEPEGKSNVGNQEDPLKNTLELEENINFMLWHPRTMVEVFRCIAERSTELAGATGTIDLRALVDTEAFDVTEATITFASAGGSISATSSFKVDSENGESFHQSAVSTFADGVSPAYSGDVELKRVMGEGDERRTQTQKSVYSETEGKLSATITRTMASDSGTLDEGEAIEYERQSGGSTALRYDAYFGVGGNQVAGTTATVSADGSGCTSRFAGMRTDDLEALIAAADQDCWDASGQEVQPD